ncbi:heavy-metal-associated domain-containing protein [Acinetobacter sp. MD2]|uniref:heavy-metal-associated domain-containing protein n=1 Tax=Acinetobacter sp. MD2 TaxID=2600066 RepID=UPI002D1ED6C3|nr:heavy-metal-associated domain-containing protein [Acinetobacter sp. MD2]MEB3767536.1 heavy-metal-associated domain-containing protein [Acinetobacter sp. MD2]
MKFEIQNMTCGGCARSVTATITTLDSNAEIHIDVEKRLVDVSSQLSADQIITALTEDGFPAVLKA